jgi:hypothetical protein
MLVRRSTLPLLIGVLVASLQSCAGGPYFRWFDPVPDDMAMVYVFRPTHDFADWQSQAVYVNDRHIASLSPSACTAYATTPGIVNVKIVGLREAYVRFEVEAGKSYFLKSSIHTISSQPTAGGIDVLTFVDHETGLQEIRDCQPSSDKPADQRETTAVFRLVVWGHLRLEEGDCGAFPLSRVNSLSVSLSCRLSLIISSSRPTTASSNCSRSRTLS